MTSGSAATIRRAGSEAIPSLQPLWKALHEHHVAVAPHLRELAAPRSAGESWAVREALYRQWLAQPGAFVMIAERDRTGVGYALVHLRGTVGSWQVGSRIAELETLVVLPGHRSNRIGRQLVDAVHDELRHQGIRQLTVSVISTNTDAIRFYERLGLLPFCVSYLGNVPPAGREAR